VNPDHHGQAIVLAVALVAPAALPVLILVVGPEDVHKQAVFNTGRSAGTVGLNATVAAQRCVKNSFPLSVRLRRHPAEFPNRLRRVRNAEELVHRCGCQAFHRTILSLDDDLGHSER
jgi:hypothetical protein